MIYVPPLHAELMSTTALTPTHHKGGIGAVVGIVAAIAIPYAAPAIAGAIGSSFGIAAIGTAAGGTAFGSALVGGLLGAGLAKVTGGNPLIGGLGGAFGGFVGAGGLSGLNAPASIGGGPVSPLNVGANPFQLSGGAPLAPTGAGQGLLSGGQGFAGLGPVGPGPQLGAFGSVSIPGGGVVVDPFSTTAGTIGSTLTGGVAGPPSPFLGADFAGAGQDTLFGGAGVGRTDTLATNISADPIGQIQNAAQTGQLPPLPTLRFTPGGSVPPTLSPTLSPNVTPLPSSGVLPPRQQLSSVGLTPSGSVAPGPPGPTFSDQLSAGFGKLKDATGKAIANALQPDRLVQAGGEFALSKLSEALADEAPRTPEEDANLAFLRQQRAEQVRLQGEKEDISDQFLAQARAISPIQRGQELLALEQDRLFRAQQAGLRALPPSLRESQRRKNVLARSRLGGFQTGQEAGRREQQQLVSRAATTLPTGVGLAKGAQEDLAASNAQFARRAQQQANVSDVFGGLFTNLNVESEEEIRKRRPV